jgi:predicted Holliday junction resolvase-like endonuclease
MKRGRTLKIAACLVALVVVSGLAGALMGRRLARVELERRDNPETWNEAAMRTFERTVRPTPEQRQKIQACLEGAIGELKTIRSDTIARSTNVIWRLVAQVEKELTPEQRKAFEQMKPKQSDLTSLELLQVEPRKK